jgi:hypothetical protein
LPTLADLAGIKVASQKPLDGKSLKALLTGSATNWPDRTLINMWNNRLSLRTQQYRLDAAGALFDMVADPEQRTDVSKERPEEAAQLRATAAKWKQELQSELGPDNRPFTVGHSAMTPLPARDGVPHGNVKRSETAPNCSFFTNWTTPDDRITWDVEVGQPGRYEAVIYYTCPAADVGSSIELSLGDAKVQSKVTAAHDPPLYGIEHDRIPRKGESFMKDFKPLSLGSIDLKPGRGQLTLRALSVPGKQVMDVRYVVLTRQ